MAIEGDSESPALVWRPGIDKLKPGERLDYDPSCYDMLHSVMLDCSCLSFDIIPDSLGMCRTAYPHVAYIVAGTQATRANKNKIYIMKWSALHRTVNDGDSSESEDEDTIIEDAKLQYDAINTDATINRIRCCPQLNRLVAAWSETAVVAIWDIENSLLALDQSSEQRVDEVEGRRVALFEYAGHSTEGYALDWNPVVVGRLLSGDCDGNLSLWERSDGGWVVAGGGSSKSNFVGPTSSVEDVKWKTIGDGVGDVFAAAGVDRKIWIYDCRKSNSKLPTLAMNDTHKTDINSIAWNCIKENLIISGADDGCCKAWDLRFHSFPVAKLHWHKSPITCVDWHPTDEATFAASCGDDTVSLWDLSVEPDDEISADKKSRDDIRFYPDQLMFHHMGQEEITELRWHPQIPGAVITTSASGFNIFKASNISDVF